MTEFFRFPHTPHLAWLGTGEPRDDKILTAEEIDALLADAVVIEEKLDGANLGFSLALDGSLRGQNRGQYLFDPPPAQFGRLPAWLAQHEPGLRAVLQPELIVFGEWCAARHSLDYAALPDWFLVFDVYDRQAEKFWSTKRRDDLAAAAGLTTVPRVHQGRVTVEEVEALVRQLPSRYRGGLELEGVVVRRESELWCEARAKLVRPDFIQTIDDHWRKRAIEWNRVDWSASS